jgi:Zn-dependent protease
MKEPSGSIFPPPTGPRRRSGRFPLRNLILFLVTLGTTTMAGAILELQFNSPEGLAPMDLMRRLMSGPAVVAGGLPFSLSLLLILGSHEMGHYIACRRYAVDASPPYFLPSLPYPFPFLGTFGAFIRIRAQIPDRNALFDIGAAGPITGFLFAIPVLILGIYDSRLEPAAADPGALVILGEPLLFRSLTALLIEPVDADMFLNMSPVLVAGWIGLLATSLNLLPVGQLDGGHICYSVSRRFHGAVSRITAILFLLFAILWHSYLVWAILLFILGRRHPPVREEWRSLSRGRRVVAILSLAIFLVSFIPDPIRVSDQGSGPDSPARPPQGNSISGPAAKLTTWSRQPSLDSVTAPFRSVRNTATRWRRSRRSTSPDGCPQGLVRPEEMTPTRGPTADRKDSVVDSRPP